MNKERFIECLVKYVEKGISTAFSKYDQQHVLYQIQQECDTTREENLFRYAFYKIIEIMNSFDKKRKKFLPLNNHLATLANETEDNLQQIKLLMYKIETKYSNKKFRGGSDFYMVRCLLSQVKSWLCTQSRVVDYYPDYYLPNKEDLDFKLDLKFLLYGIDVYKLDILNAKERFLLYLKYKGLSSYEAGNVLQHSSKMLESHYYKLITKLRSLNNAETTDTIRYCNE